MGAAVGRCWVSMLETRLPSIAKEKRVVSPLFFKRPDLSVPRSICLWIPQLVCTLKNIQSSSEQTTGGSQDCSVGKGLASKPDDLRLIPGTHVVEGKSWLLQAVL